MCISIIFTFSIVLSIYNIVSYERKKEYYNFEVSQELYLWNIILNSHMSTISFQIKTEIIKKMLILKSISWDENRIE